MNVLRINNTKIKLHFSVILVCILWILAQKADVFITMTAVIFLHEIFHAFTARMFNFHTESIEIFPFGGEAQIRGIEGNYAQEAIVVAAGPLMSLFAGFLWAKMFPDGGDFTSFSYSVAMFNLLPVYPLDGGRILMCIFKGIWGEKKGRKYTVFIGIVISGIYFIKCIYEITVFGKSQGIVMAIFMLAASLNAIKKPRSMRLREIFWKNENVKTIKVYEDERPIDILNALSGNCFYCIFVADRKENILYFLTEKQIFEGILKNSTYTLKDISMLQP